MSHALRFLVSARRSGALALGLLALLLGLLLPASLLAQQVPARPTPPRLVSDLAGVLQPDQVQALEQKLLAYNDSTSSQIAIVTVPTLNGSDIFSYSQKLFQEWGIGQKDKDNGILLLVALEDRQARIQTGRGMEGAVPDALAKRIINYRLIPAFRQQEYYQGLDQATDDLFKLLKGEYKADPEQSRGRRDTSGSGIGFWIIIGVLVLIFLFRARGGGGRGGRGGIGGGFVPPIIFGDFSGGRGVFGGGGGWGGGGGGGGGFGGFGGGSSGGGGASGSW